MRIENIIAELEHEGIFQVGKDDPNVITLGYEIDGGIVSKAFYKMSNTFERDIRLFQREKKIKEIELKVKNANEDFP